MWTERHQIQMFVLIWLFSVRGGNADKVCQSEYCITLSEGVITAEAGLCAVIPCSFTIHSFFKPQSLVWFKCEPSKQACDASDSIFSKNSKSVQSGFKGRVSQLEPDVSRRNCGIIINDITASDSGEYRLRVESTSPFGGKEHGYTFPSRATVSVKDLTQKPTVTIPPLIEGQQTSLSCTAPGLCSGSAPEITWTFRGPGENDSNITGNIIDYKTEILNAVSQRQSSTLTFNPSYIQHHNTEVTCKVSFLNNITTEETVILSVTLYPKILNSSKCEVQSEVLTCVCISEGFPLPTIEWLQLENHTEYSVMTTISKHRVNSTLVLTVRDHSNTVVNCVSSNDVGKVKHSFTITTAERREDQNGPSAVIPLAIVAAVSLIGNVVCIICLMFLWNKRKTVKPNQEDRTYASLHKTGPSAEYDVIGQPLN